jgi:hypothetical protein
VPDIPFTTAMLALAPINYWPLQETTGTTVDDRSGTSDGTVAGTISLDQGAPVWRTGAGGPGGTSLGFGGTSSDKITFAGARLMGLSAFSAVFFARSLANSSIFYQEASADNTNVIRFQVGSGGKIRFDYRADGQSLQSYEGGSDVAIVTGTGRTHMIAFTRNGATLRTYYVGARDTNGTLSNLSSNTFTAASPSGQLGGPFATAMSHPALFNRELTADEIQEIFEAFYPLVHPLWPAGKVVLPGAAIWTRPLADDHPLHRSDLTYKSAMAAKISAGSPIIQTTSWSSPLVLADPADAKVPVRLLNPQDLPILRDYLANTGARIPADAVAAGGTDGSGFGDHSYTLIDEADNALTDFWVFIQRQQAPYTRSATASTSSGTLPAGTFTYQMTAINANGQTMASGGGTKSATLAATGKITLAYSVAQPGTPAPTKYRIYRAAVTAGEATHTLLVEIDPPAFDPAVYSVTFVDDGSYGATTPNPGVTRPGITDADNTAVTTDWACSFGGFDVGYATNRGYFPNVGNGTIANGATATSIPICAGLITVEEALAAAAGDIADFGHALHMSLPLNGPSSWAYPAQRTDGAGDSTSPVEGLRCRIPSSFDLTSLSYSSNPRAGNFERCLARTWQLYGAVLSDQAGVLTLRAEDYTWAGRPLDQLMFGQGQYPSVHALSFMASVWAQLDWLVPLRPPGRVDSLGRYGSPSEDRDAPWPKLVFTPPANTVAPSVAGPPLQGWLVSVALGTWVGSFPITYTYQWQRDSGSGFADISGATGATYTVQAGDVGASIRCSVTATNAGGAAVATTPGSATIQSGSAPSVQATFSGSDGTLLTAYTPEIGAGSFTKHTSFASSSILLASNRARPSSGAGGFDVYWHSFTPGSAEYTVYFTAVIGFSSSTSNLCVAGCVARASTAADTMYIARADAHGNVTLFKHVAGTSTVLANPTGVYSTSGSYFFKFECLNATKTIFMATVPGGAWTQIAQTVDNAVTAVGKAGLFGIKNSNGSADIDDFAVV